MRNMKMYWANVSHISDLNFKIHSWRSWIWRWNLNSKKPKIQVDKRDKERNEFLEFHLCALRFTFYIVKQYNTLNYIFEYSQSQPPQCPIAT